MSYILHSTHFSSRCPLEAIHCGRTLSTNLTKFTSKIALSSSTSQWRRSENFNGWIFVRVHINTLSFFLIFIYIYICLSHGVWSFYLINYMASITHINHIHIHHVDTVKGTRAIVRNVQLNPLHPENVEKIMWGRSFVFLSE